MIQIADFSGSLNRAANQRETDSVQIITIRRRGAIHQLEEARGSSRIPQCPGGKLAYPPLVPEADMQEYIRDETHNLRHELIRAQEEVKRIQSVPLVIGQFLEAVDEKRGIVGSTTGELHHYRRLSS